MVPTKGIWTYIVLLNLFSIGCSDIHQPIAIIIEESWKTEQEDVYERSSFVYEHEKLQAIPFRADDLTRTSSSIVSVQFVLASKDTLLQNDIRILRTSLPKHLELMRTTIGEVAQRVIKKAYSSNDIGILQDSILSALGHQYFPITLRYQDRDQRIFLREVLISDLINY